MATKASTKLLRVLRSDGVGFQAEWDVVRNREAAPDPKLEVAVRKAIDVVRSKGDAPLLKVLEACGIEGRVRLELTQKEWDAGCEAVDPTDRAAIGKAATRVRDFHRKRVPSSWEMREEGGGHMGQRVRPMARVGICLPNVKAIDPASVIMNTTPASVVEVPEIILCAPPREDGTVAPETLIAARVAGVHRVFKASGASAMAAMSFGTDSLPRVDKIVSRGDAEIELAKHMLAGRVALCGSWGAGEICMIADKTATPAWIAADLLSHAETSPAARVVLITHYKSIAARVQEQLERRLNEVSKKRAAKQALTKLGAIVLTKNLAESLALANDYAPERLVLAIEAPEVAAKGVHNAGAIFLGHYTPPAVGCYLAGPNHALPTGGTARFDSPLGVDDFLKRTSFIKFEPPKLRELGADVIRLASVEGLSGHGVSVDLRLQKIRRARREREAAREAEL
jgi:histidinol dehydrogenase